jgi:hypothetical protein
MTSLLRSLAVACCLTAICTSALPAQESTDEVQAEAAKKFQAYARQAAAAYDLRAESADGHRLVLTAEPVLRWANPLGGRRAHGDVFLWTDEGRPAAVLSIYEFDSPDGGKVHEHHEFCSLATCKIVGDGPDERDWSPDVAGVTLAPLDDAPTPADTATGRLSQMRDLAGRFAGSKVTREEQAKRDLRVLSRPVLRYESKHHAVSDGALFALVEATDPEILLVIEARPHEGKPHWHFALARMNSLELAASYQDREVWRADVQPWKEIFRRTEKTYMIFLIR